MADDNHYQQKIHALEQELDEMTAALSHAWDQLVPFLQEVPTQADNLQDVEPILQAVSAAADAPLAGIYLFQTETWYSVPRPTTLSDKLTKRLKTLNDVKIVHDTPDTDGIRWALVTVRSDKELVGVLGIGTESTEKRFTAVDIRILKRMAERIGNQIAATELAEFRQKAALQAKELQIANDIQQSVQPETMPSHPRFQLASYWRPAKEVGGDAWGWVHQYEERMAWFVLDVAGKGLPAALAAVAMHTAISMALRMRLAPEAVMHLINEQFYDAFTRTDLMATVAIIFLNLENGSLAMVNAGHPPVLVRHKSKWLRFAASAPPIGVLPELQVETDYLMLAPDDLILCHTDGFTEIQHQTRLWGQTGLLKAIPGGARKIEALTRYIVAAAERIGRISDDQTLVTAIYTEKSDEK